MGLVRLPDFDKIRDYIFERAVQEELPRFQRNASTMLAKGFRRDLAGERTGRVYYNPRTGAPYKASKPNEIPAERTGDFRASWRGRGMAIVRDGDGAHTAIVAETKHKVYSGGSSLHPGRSGKKRAWNLGWLLYEGRKGGSYRSKSGRDGSYPPMEGRRRYPYDLAEKSRPDIQGYAGRFRWGWRGKMKDTATSFNGGSDDFAQYVEVKGVNPV